MCVFRAPPDRSSLLNAGCPRVGGKPDFSSHIGLLLCVKCCHTTMDTVGTGHPFRCKPFVKFTNTEKSTVADDLLLLPLPAAAMEPLLLSRDFPSPSPTPKRRALSAICVTTVTESRRMDIHFGATVCVGIRAHYFSGTISSRPPFGHTVLFAMTFVYSRTHLPHISRLLFLASRLASGKKFALPLQNAPKPHACLCRKVVKKV